MKNQSLVFVLGVSLFLGIAAASDFNENDYEVLSRQKRKVFFPQNSVLQISMCIIAQISSLTSHRVAINAGFQINYGLPYRLQDFYSPIFWARQLSNETNPMINFFERLAQSDYKTEDYEKYDRVEGDNDEADDDVEDSESEDDLDPATTEISTNVETTTKKRRRKSKSKRDLSAGQFYSGIKDLMEYTGYHEDCLLKSVCELAQHPLHEDEDNVVNEVLHFILTPSLHNSFDSESEAEEKKLFEEAEELGKSGADCELLYGSNCETSPLHKISSLKPHDSNKI